jgi:hypothetical protein
MKIRFTMKDFRLAIADCRFISLEIEEINKGEIENGKKPMSAVFFSKKNRLQICSLSSFFSFILLRS